MEFGLEAPSVFRAGLRFAVRESLGAKCPGKVILRCAVLDPAEFFSNAKCRGARCCCINAEGFVHTEAGLGAIALGWAHSQGEALSEVVQSFRALFL